MEESDGRQGESDVLSLSLHPIDGLPKEIHKQKGSGTVVISEGDSVSTWIKARV